MKVIVGNDNSGFGETVLLTGIFLLWVLLMSMWFLFARNRQNDRGIEKHNSNGGDVSINFAHRICVVTYS